MDRTKEIINLILAKGNKNKDIADVLGLSVNAITHYKKGRREISLTNFEKLLKAYNLTVCGSTLKVSDNNE